MVKGWLAATMFLGALVVSGTPQASADTSSECSQLRNRTLRVVLRAERPKVDAGDLAIVDVRVVRTLKGAVLGPAEGVDVSVSLTQGQRYGAAFATTDAEGFATLSVPTDALRRGLADGRAYASKMTVPTHCITAQEYGTRHRSAFLLIS